MNSLSARPVAAYLIAAGGAAYGIALLALCRYS
jgi:hypothetical protein